MAIAKYRAPSQPTPRVPRDPTLNNMPRPQRQPYRVPNRPTPLRPEPTGYQTPSKFWKGANPPQWEQVQRPVLRKWSPDYQPSYWEQPLNIARHYWQMKNMPAGERLPDWIDPQSLDVAYRYVSHIQDTEDWVNWKHIHPDDPVRPFLQSLEGPPLDYLLSPEEYQQWTMAQLGQMDPDQWDEQLLGALTPEQRGYYDEAAELWKTKVPFEELPTWQQMSYSIQQNPILSGAATMVPFAIAGGTAGLSGGLAAGGVGAIPGLLLGAGIPLALGAGLGAAAEFSPSAANLLNKLDVFAEGAERAIGLGLQVEGALLDEDAYGSLNEIMENLPAAWDASTAAYSVGAPLSGEITPFGPATAGAFGMEPWTGRADITNIFPAVEYAFRYITGNDPEKIQFSSGMEAWPRLQVVTDAEGQRYAIGDTAPVELDAVGLSALVQARRRMIAGEDPEQVINDYMYQFGFSAEFAELAGHIALDPLNVMPRISSKGVAMVGRKAGNIPLARAFENSHGVMQGWKQYGNFIRTGLAGPVDDLTAAQKFIGGLNEQGVIRSLDPEYIPTNPLNRAFMWMFDMTPDAKARTYVSTMADNMSATLDFRRGDFPGQIDLMRTMIKSDPSTMATIAPFLGSPEFATMRQSMASFGKQLDDLDGLWRESAPQRDVLNGLSRILDEEIPDILRELHTDGADNLYQRLVNKVNDSDPAMAASLADDALMGDFTPESLQKLADAYTGDNPIPWHPDEAAARLWGAFNEHSAQWSVKAYGVEPSKPLVRFFDTLKRAQSVVLLGFNPAYAVNNAVNNSVTRAATGIFGYSTPTKIGKFIDRFGYEPYRFEAGVGAAGITPDINLGISDYEQAIGQRIGAVGSTGEETIRGALHTPDGKIRRGIDWLNKFGFANKLSSSVERLESQQAFHVGLRQFMDNNWVRGKGFETVPPPLRNALEQFGGPGTSERIMRIVETSLSKEEALAKIFGEGAPKYDPNSVVREVFRDFGVDEGVGRSTLGPVYDEIVERLGKENTTLDDVRATFDDVRRSVDDFLDDQLAAELKTRVDQVSTQVGSAGYAEILRTFQEHELHMAELNTQHFMAWDETFLKAEELRAAGASVEVVSAVFDAQKIEANRLWRRSRKFERASMMGMLDGLGIDDVNGRQYSVGLDGMAKRWDSYFEVVNRERLEFRRAEFETPDLREVAYQRMVDRHMAYYDEAIGDVKGIQAALDDIFVDMNGRVFGEEASAAAQRYRATMSELAHERYQMQRAHREATAGEPADVRRRASRDFYNNQYLPFIQEMFRREIEGAGQYGKTVTGDMPQTEFVRPVGQPGMGMPEGPPGPVPPQQPLTTPPPQGFPETLDPNQPGLRYRQATTYDRVNLGKQDQPAPPVEAPPVAAPPQPPPRTSADTAPVFEVAQEFGIESTRTNENGTVSFQPGAKTHIFNIVRQVDPSIQHFDEITPELARASFEARAERHAAELQFQQAVDELTSRFGGLDPAAAAEFQARQLGVSMARYLDELDPNNLPEATQNLQQINASMMLDEVQAAQRKYDKKGRGVPITDTEGYVTGVLSHGYPEWWKSVSKYINVDGQKIRGYDAVTKALEMLMTGEELTNHKIFTDLKQTGLTVHYRNIDDAAKAGAIPPVEAGFQAGTWLDDIGQFQEQLGQAVLSDPEVVSGLYDDFVALTEAAPIEIQAEFGGLLDDVWESVQRSVVRSQEAMTAPRLPAPIPGPVDITGQGGMFGVQDTPLFGGTPTRPVDDLYIPTKTDAPGVQMELPESAAPEGAIVPAGLDPDEYYFFLQQAAENKSNLARLIDESNRMVDEATPFPDQSPGEWHAEADARPIDIEKALALVEEGERRVTPYGPYPPGVIENISQPKYDSIHQSQMWAERVRPMLDALEQKLIANGENSFTMGGQDLPPGIKSGLDNYFDGVWRDLSTNKLGATKWAENLRDQALLNYSQRRGFDTWMQAVFPYEFWFTRSMYQWAQRAIDRPAWFANYGRIRNFMTNRMQNPGFPSRLANKMSIPAPYLPEWAGGNIWVDPIRKTFPIEEFAGPVDYYAQSKSEEERRAENLIVQWHGRGSVGTQEASQAFSTRSGALWEKAKGQARIEAQGETADPASWMNTIMSPALYLTLPAHLLTGKDPMTGREDTNLLPITKTGNALKSVTENTPLHMVGQIAGSILAAPENTLRRAAGLSEFGDWGDYYVERMMTNMVAEGLYLPDDAVRQMIEKQGPAYDEAVSRVQLEQAFKIPGSLPLYAGLHGASASEFMSALAFGWMPAGLFPEGELEQRGLAERYKHAREQYNLGDDRALSEFFDANPALESRMALWDEPDERMRQFLITEVWNRYSDMSRVDKQTAREQFGEMFQQGFLDDETRNYDMLDVETLAYWSNALGGEVPATEQTSPLLSAPDFLQDKISLAPPIEAAAVDAYRQVRNDLYPNWYALQNAFFSIEKEDRNAFKAQFPELESYWRWNRDYKAENPIIDKYTKQPAEKDIPVSYDLSFAQDFTSGLTRQLYSHYYANTPLTGGTLEELTYLWNTNGRPGGDFETFLDDILRSAVAP